MNEVYKSPQKIAILLLSLGEDLAAELLSKLPKDDVRDIAEAMVRLRYVDKDMVNSIQDEFIKTIEPKDNVGISDLQSLTRRILQRSLPNSELITQTTSHDLKSFHEAEKLDGKVLWRLISTEHPQTITLILAHLSPKKSSELLTNMHPQIRTDILLRLATLQDVDRQSLQDLDVALSAIIQRARQNPTQQRGGPEKTAKILAFLSPEHRKHLVSEMESKSSELANAVKANLFTFEDIVKLDRFEVEKLIAKIQPQDLELALRKCSPAITELFFSSMSERRAAQLKETIATTKPAPISKVTEAQRNIASLATEMIASGALRDPLDEVV
jgi:flagellar motor switch protein FliG